MTRRTAGPGRGRGRRAGARPGGQAARAQGLPQLSPARARAAARPDRAARRERRRQDQPARGGLAAGPGRGLRAGAARRARSRAAAAPGRLRAELDGPPGPVEIAHRPTIRRPSGARVGVDGQALRSQNGLGEHRQPALADAGHGPAVRRRRRRAATLPRPAGAGDRSGARRPGRRLRARVARALAPAARRPARSGLAGARSSGASPRPAVAMAAARRELRAGPRTPSWPRPTLPFPRPRLRLAGEVEALARRPAGAGGRAAAGGDAWRRTRAERRRDRRCRGRAAPQRSRRHRRAATARPAARCSTGRQKAYPDQHRAGRGARCAGAGTATCRSCCSTRSRPTSTRAAAPSCSPPWSSSAPSSG